MVGIVMTVAIPYMINPDEANMRGKMGLFFGESRILLWFRGGRQDVFGGGLEG
jgi:hypothetical protein